ncbi:ABC transporter ATP-binding protein [Nonomuraea sp. SYSU D8015]|uniref:ABC transporter ATP-binding protein n=1 Tax=Nonomuraea sp. SYSU D8015 TaxID=2593644 RepID=UPI0016602877|nr:ABC transporter ATP-binding protein/permease [Nonomuraea sp. SYSU D8015]
MTTPPTSVDRPLWRLLPTMASRPLVFALVIASGLVSYGMVVLVPALTAYQLGGLLTGRAESLTLQIAVAVLVAGVAAWWQTHIGHDWAYRLLKVLRLRLFDGLERATPGRLLGRRTGELADIAKNDVSATETFFAHTAGDYVGAVAVSLASVAVVASVDVAAAAVIAAVMLLIAVVPAALSRRAGEQGRAVRAAAGAVAGETVEVIQGLRELALARRGHDVVARVLARTEELRAHHRAYARRAGLELVATELLLGLGLLALALRAVAGAVEPRWIPVLIVLGVSAPAPIATVSATARTLGDVRAAAGRVLAVIGYPPHVREPDEPEPVRDALPGVAFGHVRFGYPGSDQEVLRGVSFQIRAGETVALAGPSGAGKTTLANMLLRFWDVSAGAVTIGGVDVRRLSTGELRRTVSVVPQDVYLFHDTIAGNIRLGRPGATDAEVEQAARLAGAHDFITALPDGYRTLCGERGASLSGGQRQRIAIARALLTGAPVLVLDEAVSGLDTEAERALHDGLSAARGTRTTLIIAHRISTLRRADRVVLLDGGVVVASGTHDELVAGSAAYRRLTAGRLDAS